ncbi:hypothetical protein [Moheibacter stercoris]|uniref:Uncharacterized protein n=1 Tax=Moheibacter stercoris TaxID=1628251 RepID=A0ABV2LU55_9FLAO
MKNFFIILIISLTFLNCSSQKYTSHQKKLIDKYELPNFSHAEITMFAIEYIDYYNQLMEAANAGDATKLQELTAQGVEWSKKASEWTQKMTAEDAQKWVDWASKLQDAATKR